LLSRSELTAVLKARLYSDPAREAPSWGFRGRWSRLRGGWGWKSG